MTREEQDTDRALIQSERAWLVARGWSLVAGSNSVHPFRYSHPGAPSAKTDYTQRDALAMTRADPLRFKARRYAGTGPA